MPLVRGSVDDALCLEELEAESTLHAGQTLTLKTQLREHLAHRGIAFEDLGAKTLDEDDDYPRYAYYVASKVLGGADDDRGILICGSGQGMSMAAYRADLKRQLLRFRVLNLVACIVLTGFNAVLEIWPMVAMNIVLSAINLWHIRKLVSTRHDEEAYDVLEVVARAGSGRRPCCSAARRRSPRAGRTTAARCRGSLATGRSRT